MGLPFNFTLDAIHKRSRFSKTCLKKGLKFILCEEVGPDSFSPSLMLLLPEINPLLEEQNRKKYIFVTFSISYFEMVLVVPAEVVIFYVQAFIV